MDKALEILTALPKEELQTVFQEADKDGKGKLTAKEMKSLLLSLAEKNGDKIPSGAVVDDILKLLMMIGDVDGDKMLNYEEFVTIVTQPGPDPDRMTKAMFMISDADGDGKISVQEFCKFLKLGASMAGDENADESQFPHMAKVIIELSGIDKDGDGKLSFEEFTSFL